MNTWVKNSLSNAIMFDRFSLVVNLFVYFEESVDIVLHITHKNLLCY